MDDAYYRLLELFGHSMRVRRADGRSEPFTLTGGVWQGDPDSALSVTEDATGFTVIVENGDAERYNLTGTIQWVQSPQNQTWTWAYSPQTGLLSSVTDSLETCSAPIWRKWPSAGCRVAGLKFSAIHGRFKSEPDAGNLPGQHDTSVFVREHHGAESINSLAFSMRAGCGTRPSATVRVTPQQEWSPRASTPAGPML